MTDSSVQSPPTTTMGRLNKFCTIKITGRVLDFIVLALGNFLIKPSILRLHSHKLCSNTTSIYTTALGGTLGNTSAPASEQKRESNLRRPPKYPFTSSYIVSIVLFICFYFYYYLFNRKRAACMAQCSWNKLSLTSGQQHDSR